MFKITITYVFLFQVKITVPLVLLALMFDAATCVVPSGGADVNRLELIKTYFYCGYLYKDIIILLHILHGIKLSLRQLKRILKTNHLSRNKNKTPEDIVRDHIRAQIQRSSDCFRL